MRKFKKNVPEKNIDCVFIFAVILTIAPAAGKRCACAQAINSKKILYAVNIKPTLGGIKKSMRVKIRKNFSRQFCAGVEIFYIYKSCPEGLKISVNVYNIGYLSPYDEKI